MNEFPKIKSGFAALDVKDGRHELAAHFRKTPRGERTHPRDWIPVTITGWITGINSEDDGVSREFEVDVKSVVIGKEGCT